MDNLTNQLEGKQMGAGASADAVGRQIQAMYQLRRNALVVSMVGVAVGTVVLGLLTAPAESLKSDTLLDAIGQSIGFMDGLQDALTILLALVALNATLVLGIAIGSVGSSDLGRELAHTNWFKSIEKLATYVAGAAVATFVVFVISMDKTVNFWAAAVPAFLMLATVWLSTNTIRGQTANAEWIRTEAGARTRRNALRLRVDRVRPLTIGGASGEPTRGLVLKAYLFLCLPVGMLWSVLSSFITRALKYLLHIPRKPVPETIFPIVFLGILFSFCIAIYLICSYFYNMSRSEPISNNRFIYIALILFSVLMILMIRASVEGSPQVKNLFLSFVPGFLVIPVFIGSWDPKSWVLIRRLTRPFWMLLFTKLEDLVADLGGAAP